MFSQVDMKSTLPINLSYVIKCQGTPQSEKPMRCRLTSLK